MRQHLNNFFISLAFFTRIPCPSWVNYATEQNNTSVVFAPLIGLIIGALTAAVLAFTVLLLPLTIAVVISMLASILLTGALHEDGFADVCDGFGGGWQRQQILTIMQDSQLGTYGVIGLLLILLLKWLLLVEIGQQAGILALSLLLIASHSCSRWVAISFMRSYDYLRPESTAKARPMSQRLDLQALAIAGLFALLGLLPWLFYHADVYFGSLFLLAMALAWWLCKWRFIDTLGGYTGDCLGAVQQLTEISCYLAVCTAIYLQLRF